MARYDPRKRREYYLRTRKLKGRKKGGKVDESVKTGSRFVGGLVKPRTSTNPREKGEVAAQVARLTTKLGQLKRELAKREQDAREAERKAAQGPSAADKRKKARESKQYRDKNQQVLKTKAKAARAKSGSTTPSKSGGSKDSIDELRSRIEKVERNLAAAVARQRALR